MLCSTMFAALCHCRQITPTSIVGGGFSPHTLFASSEDGAFYDPSDLTSLFQERTGASATTPSGVGDVVGSMLDLSGNDNHAIAPSDAARPILRQSGALYYLEPDGVDDWMPTSPLVSLGDTWSHVGGWQSAGDSERPFATSNSHLGALRPLSGKWRWYDSLAALQVITGSTPNDVHVLTLEQAGNTTMDARYDGVQDQSTIVPYDTTSQSRGLALFSQRNTAATSPWSGKFYGGTWIDRALTADERSDLETYWAAKSGVTL